MAQPGAQVMQQRAVELGWVNEVVIEVLSSFEDAPGTLIKEDPFVEQRNKVRGLAHDRNVAKVTIVEVPDRPGVAHAIFAPLADAGVSVDVIVQNVSHGGTTDMSFTVTRTDLPKARRILDPVARELGAREITTDASVAKVSIVGSGIQNAPGYAARMFEALAAAGVNIEAIATSEIRITCLIAEDSVEAALRSLHAALELEQPDQIDAAGAPLARATSAGAVTEAPFLSHQERFAVVGSTNDVVRGWLAAGTPEVRLAVADEQTAGRGRAGRSWQAPPGGALLLSLGFRPTTIPPGLVWRLPACVALAMADAAEEVAALADGTIGFKWPNDLVVDNAAAGGVRKVAGVLGESDGLGSDDPRVVIGIGINADWRRDDFPLELADSMTSLARSLERAAHRSGPACSTASSIVSRPASSVYGRLVRHR